MKGVILGLETERGNVVILGHDDNRYHLQKSEWKSVFEPKVGMAVDFVTAAGGLAREAYHIPSTIENQVLGKIITEQGGSVIQTTKNVMQIVDNIAARRNIGLVVCVLILAMLLLFFGVVFETSKKTVQSATGAVQTTHEIGGLRADAENGDAMAQYQVGFQLINSRDMGNDDNVEAVKWFRKAAAQNFAPAQFSLGCSYDEGRGVAKDEVEALKWYRKAAEQNYAMAQNELGACYGSGLGVERNYVEAYKWFALAAKQGDEEGKENVTKLEGIMSPEQVEQAKLLASSFR